VLASDPYISQWRLAALDCQPLGPLPPHGLSGWRFALWVAPERGPSSVALTL